MPKHIVIVGMIEAYEGPFTDDQEIWCVNRAFAPRNDEGIERYRQENVSAVFVGDEFLDFGEEFVDQLNALNVPVMCKSHHPEVPLSEPFPLKEVVDNTGLEYFGCTVAFMIAAAVALNPKRITICGAMHIDDSWEYMLTKGNLDMWLAFALGRGIEIEAMKKTALLQPMPWEARIYGYQIADPACHNLVIQTMRAAYIACMEFPRKFTDTPELKEYDSVRRIERAGTDRGATEQPPPPHEAPA